MRMRILAEEPRWLTTADAARALQVTPRWVRWLARMKELPCTQTRSGLWLFRESDVLRLAERRAKARGRGQAVWWAVVRPQMLKATLEPRQPRFRLVRSCGQSERSLPQAEVKPADAFRKRSWV